MVGFCDKNILDKSFKELVQDKNELLFLPII